jgi:hypothetical protein
MKNMAKLNEWIYVNAKETPLSKRIKMWIHNEYEGQKSEENQQEILREQKKHKF